MADRMSDPSVRVSVEIISWDSMTGVESVLQAAKASTYDPMTIDRLLNICLDGVSVTECAGRETQATISISADVEPRLRAALYLTAATLRRLARIGASFDCDVYV